MLVFLSIQKDNYTTGVHIGRLGPAQEIVSRVTNKHEDGNWYTDIIIKASVFFTYHKIAYIIKPQKLRIKRS